MFINLIASIVLVSQVTGSAQTPLPRFEQVQTIPPFQREPGVIYTMGTAASSSHERFNEFVQQAIQKSPVVVVVDVFPRQMHHVQVSSTDQQSGSTNEQYFCDNTAHFVALRPSPGTPYTVKVIPGNPGSAHTVRIWVFEAGKQVEYKSGSGVISYSGMTF